MVAEILVEIGANSLTATDDIFKTWNCLSPVRPDLMKEEWSLNYNEKKRHY
jgi:hypothetical protein